MATAPCSTVGLRYPHALYIDGRWTSPSSDAAFEVADSATETVFLTIAEAQEDDAHRAVAAARKAFDSGPWPRLSPAERGQWLLKLADALEESASPIAESWSREVGTIALAASLAGYVLPATLREHAGYAESFDWVSHRTSATGGPGLLVSEAVGVVAAIIPWNAPAHTLASKLAPALIAGCTIIVKASPEAPTVPYLLAEACEAIGLPDGVVNVITADRAVSEALIRHADVDKVSFTGSTIAGRRIAAACGQRIARVTLELGGKSPAVICDDFDVGEAAAAIAQAATFSTGQVCMLPTRLIVSRHRHDAFVEALVESYGAVVVGDPFDAATHMGPLAFARQRDRVEGYIAQGLAQGARLACGGGRPRHLDRGFYLEPTVFAHVASDQAIAQEEIFGPVLSVIPVADEEEAITVANDTIYGLNSSVFTQDIDKAYLYGRRIRAGTVAHNRVGNDMTIAFGGFKQSGIGREGGIEGLQPYLEKKTMLFSEMPQAALA